MHIAPEHIAALAGVGLIAGTIDAIAGGGGLLTLPALLLSGLPPHLALGTNKGQSVFGSFAATARFWRAGTISADHARLAFPLGLLGSLIGAQLVLVLRPETLEPVVLVVLPIVALTVTLRPPQRGPADRSTHRARLVAGLIAFGIAAYDGFLGPGTGTFLIVAYIGLLGARPLQASADAKVVNFASNLAAVALFASRGLVLWELALPMAAGQFAGGWIGAHLTTRVGDRLVRVFVLLAVVGVVVKLAGDLGR